MEAGSPHCHLRIFRYVFVNSSLALILKLKSLSYYYLFLDDAAAVVYT